MHGQLSEAGLSGPAQISSRTTATLLPFSEPQQAFSDKVDGGEGLVLGHFITVLRIVDVLCLFLSSLALLLPAFLRCPLTVEKLLY